jgi:negative regulator of sigma E activity
VPPLPTADPSASLAPFQVYTVQAHAWFADLGQLGYVAGVTAAAAILFTLAAVLVVSTFSRGAGR